MRLQSDSSFLGQLKAGVPSGTYNQLSVNLDTVITYCAATSGTQGCNTGSVAQFTKSFATPTTSNFTLTLAVDQQAGLRVQINFANALTVNSSTQAVTGVNLTATNVVTTLSLPPATSTLSFGQLDYIEDVTGVVTAASSSSVTLQTATRGTITSAVTGTTLASPNCVIQNQPRRATVGQIASFDATLNSDGTSTMLQYDPLSNASLDVIEGIVTTLNTSTAQFQIVANDFVAATSGSIISGLNLGDPVNVTLTATVKPFLLTPRVAEVWYVLRQHFGNQHTSWPDARLARNQLHGQIRDDPGVCAGRYRGPAFHARDWERHKSNRGDLQPTVVATVFRGNRITPGSNEHRNSDYLFGRICEHR
jgi:hypothetical protein